MWSLLFIALTCAQIAYGSSFVRCKPNAGDSFLCEYPNLTQDDSLSSKLSPDLNDKAISIKVRSSSQIHRIPAEIFTTFPNLEDLKIQTNISEISSQEFLNAMHLRNLNMADNKLKKLTVDTLPPNKLTQLFMSFNEIESIDDFTFANQSSLKTLDLQHNEIATIKTNTFAGLLNLDILHLGNNEIDTIEDNAFNLPKLTFLVLRSNKIKSLNENSFAGLLKLKSLYLNSNPLEMSIDSLALSQLTNLKQLKLGNTGIKLSDGNSVSNIELPLKVLNLEANNITDIGDLEYLRIFPQLHDLDLRENNFKTFDLSPEWMIETWPHLKLLKFTAYTEHLGKCRMLQSEFRSSHKTRQIEVKCEEEKYVV